MQTQSSKSTGGMSSAATNFSWIKRVQESDLPSSSKLVLFNLVAYTNMRLDPVFPSYAKQAKDTGLSRRTVIRHLHELDGRWIFLEDRTRANGSSTTCLIHFLIPEEVTEEEGEGDTVTLPGDTVTPPEQTNKQTTLSIIGDARETDDPVYYLQEHWKSAIPIYYADLVRATVKNLALWKSVLAMAVEAGWKLTNVRNLLREYREQSEAESVGASKYARNAVDGLAVEDKVLQKLRGKV